MSDQLSSLITKLTEVVSNGPKVYQQGIYEGSYQYWASVQNYGRRTDYSYAFARWAGETIEPPYAVKTDNCMYMFLDCHNVKNLSNLKITHTSNNPNLMYLCSNCIQLENPPILAFNNTHSIKTFTSMFSNCTHLKSCNIWWGDGTEDALTVRANCANMFFKCYELTDATFSGVGSPRSLDLSYCSKLSATSVASLLASLADVSTATSGNFSIKLATSVYDNLSSDMKTAFTNRGWTLQSDSHREPEAADPLYLGLITASQLTAEFGRGISLKAGSYYKAAEVINAPFTLIKLPISDDSGIDSWLADSDSATTGKYVFTLNDEMANIVGSISGFNNTEPPTVCLYTNSGVKSHTLDQDMAYVAESKTLQETVSKPNNTQLKLSQKYVWDYITISANYIVSCAVDEYLYWNGMYWEKLTEAPATMPTSFTKLREVDLSSQDELDALNSALSSSAARGDLERGSYYVIKPLEQYTLSTESQSLPYTLNIDSNKCSVASALLSSIKSLEEGEEDYECVALTLPANTYKLPQGTISCTTTTTADQTTVYMDLEASAEITWESLDKIIVTGGAPYDTLIAQNSYFYKLLFFDMSQAAKAYGYATALALAQENMPQCIEFPALYKITIQPYETRNRFLIWNGTYWESSDTLALA